MPGVKTISILNYSEHILILFLRPFRLLDLLLRLLQLLEADHLILCILQAKMGVRVHGYSYFRMPHQILQCLRIQVVIFGFLRFIKSPTNPTVGPSKITINIVIMPTSPPVSIAMQVASKSYTIRIILNIFLPVTFAILFVIKKDTASYGAVPCPLCM